MSDPTPRQRHDVAVGKVLLVGLGLLLTLGLILAAMAGLLNLFNSGGGLVNAAPTPESFAQPQLQVAPAQEWQAVQATQEARLHNYGWVSEEEGVARIPIERAMALIVTQGLPTPLPSATPTITATLESGSE